MSKTTNSHSALKSIRENRIVIIYRGFNPGDCLKASKVLYDAGIRLFEVTMNSEDTTESISLLQSELESDTFVGAGTVMETEQVELAYKAGASFILSPNTDVEVIKRTKELTMTSIPGAMTPTEVTLAAKTGGDLIKVFPINTLGPEYINQLQGPLDNIDFLACGGIEIEMVEDLFQAGSTAIGVGVQLLGDGLIENRNWDLLHRRGRQLIRASGLQILSQKA